MNNVELKVKIWTFYSDYVNILKTALYDELLERNIARR